MESPRPGPAHPPSHLSGSQSSLGSEAGTGATEPQGGTPSRPEPRVPGEYCLGSVQQQLYPVLPPLVASDIFNSSCLLSSVPGSGEQRSARPISASFDQRDSEWCHLCFFVTLPSSLAGPGRVCPSPPGPCSVAEQANASLNPGREIWGCVESTTPKGGFLGALVFPWDRCSKQCLSLGWCSLAQHGSIRTQGTDSLKDWPQLVWATLARGPQTHT